MPSGRKPIPLADRFWPKVDKRGPDDCWHWTGAEHGKGYGGISVDGKSQPAHRVSWELARGPVPAGQWILHRCDQPKCVNPAHLFLGDHQDNMNDMKAKYRAANQYMSQSERRECEVLWRLTH